MKNYIGDCITNPFGLKGLLIKVINEGVEITPETFLKHVNLRDFTLHGNLIRKEIKQYPHDFKFYSYKGGNVYFFRHSGIEYFFR